MPRPYEPVALAARWMPGRARHDDRNLTPDLRSSMRKNPSDFSRMLVSTSGTGYGLFDQLSPDIPPSLSSRLSAETTPHVSASASGNAATSPQPPATSPTIASCVTWTDIPINKASATPQEPTGVSRPVIQPRWRASAPRREQLCCSAGYFNLGIAAEYRAQPALRGWVLESLSVATIVAAMTPAATTPSSK